MCVLPTDFSSAEFVLSHVEGLRRNDSQCSRLLRQPLRNDNELGLAEV